MELKATIKQVLPMTGGVSQSGNQWQKVEVIVTTMSQYPKDVCVQFFNDKVQQVMSFMPGTAVNIAYDLESREFNGRWYTDVKCYKIEPAMPQMAPQMYPQQFAQQPMMAQQMAPQMQPQYPQMSQGLQQAGFVPPQQYAQQPQQPQMAPQMQPQQPAPQPVQANFPPAPAGYRLEDQQKVQQQPAPQPESDMMFGGNNNPGGLPF